MIIVLYWIAQHKQIMCGNSQERILTDNQVERLNMLDVIWDGKYDIQWNKMYEDTFRYYEEHRKLDIPVSYKSDNGALGKWIRRQRNNKKLSDMQKTKLNKIGMKWIIDNPWDKRFNLAKRYYDEHGNINISQSYIEDGIWIGKWMYQQRKEKEKLMVS